jgi:hypothetical protein
MEGDGGVRSCGFPSLAKGPHKRRQFFRIRAVLAKETDGVAVSSFRKQGTTPGTGVWAIPAMQERRIRWSSDRWLLHVLRS